MVSVQPGHISLHCLGMDHRLLRHYKSPEEPDTVQPPGWADMEAKKGIWCFEPFVISRVLNEYSCFLVNENHQLVQSNFDLTMSFNMDPILVLGGRLKRRPFVCTRSGTLHIFHVGLDHAVYHKAWDGLAYYPSEGFERISGGLFRQEITATSSSPDQVSLFAIDAETGHLKHHEWKKGKGWHNQADISGTWAPGALSAVSHTEGQWDVFGINAESAINHAYSHPAAKEGENDIIGFEVIPGQYKTVDAISCGSNEMDIFMWGYDSTVSHKSWKNGSWEGWNHFVGGLRQRPWLVWSGRSLLFYSMNMSHTACTRVRDQKTSAWSEWIVIPGVIFGGVS